MSVDLGNIRFLCGWYDLYWFVSFESGCDQVVQTFPNPTSYQGQFFTDGCRLFGRSGLFISWLRASVFPVCYFVTGYRPWLCCQTLSRILFKGILYSWIAKSRSLWVKWSCSTVLGHSSKTCWISTRQRSVWAVGSLICDGICQSAETMDDDVFEGLVASESPLVAVVVDLESVGWFLVVSSKLLIDIR